MIPDIYEILKGLKEGAYTLEGAELWIHLHIELAIGEYDKQAERRELFLKMFFSCLERGSLSSHDLSMDYVGKQTDRLMIAADEFASKKDGEG